MTLPIHPEAVIAALHPSGPRRVVGVAVLGVLAFVVITMALRHPADTFGWSLFLLAFGLGALWLAWRMWQATGVGLLLTDTHLCTTEGTLVALVAEITEVNRGTFSIRPAGGFTLVTLAPGARAWQPGLWWRSGRRIGVGGVTPRYAGRFMAEQIAILLAARSQRP